VIVVGCEQQLFGDMIVSLTTSNESKMTASNKEKVEENNGLFSKKLEYIEQKERVKAMVLNI